MKHKKLSGLRYEPGKRTPGELCYRFLESSGLAILIGSEKRNLFSVKTSRVRDSMDGIASAIRDSAISRYYFNKQDQGLLVAEI